MVDFELDERSQLVLQAVINCYITSADPVGSRTLCKQYKLGFSPATLRNIMADLEEMGLLQHPYTSAGRVPTELGYRFYVDCLFKQRRLKEEKLQELQRIYSQLGAEENNMFEAVCRLLSLTSQYIGVLLAPRLGDTIFNHIKFIRLRPCQVLVVFVSQTGVAQQRVIEVKEDYQQDKLDRMADFLNDHLEGLSLYQLRERLLKMMAQNKHLYDQLLRDALELSKELLVDDDEGNIYIEGQLNMLNQPEFSTVEKMKKIFQAFEEKKQIVQILDSCLSGEGVRILIGSETEADQMSDCSLVSATYSNRGRVVGALGVIGPTRMHYSHVIPLVEYAAKLLSEILSKE